MALSGFVSNVKLKLQVDGATSTEDDPTPIWQLDELVAALSAGDAKAGVDAVCARLAHRSPVVKQKALKLVAHVGRKGSPELRRLMSRHSGAVRDLLHFRCEPDPFKGDTVWKRVQEYAQEALEAVHGTGPEPAAQAHGSLGGRIQGFGRDVPGGGGGGYSGGYGGASSGMVGFGSDSVGGYGGGGGGGGGGSSGRMMGFGSADVLQSGMQALSSGMRSLSGRGQDGYSASLLGSGPGGDPSRLGGSAGGAIGGGPIVQSGAASLSGKPSASSSAAAGPSAASSGGASSGQHAAEQRLVERICTPAGLRAAPGSEDLRAFVEGLGPLDGPAVARLLERKLESGPWQSTLRALCAIEAVAEGGSSAACGQLAVHFQAHPEVVRKAAASPHASVKQRAQKLLGLLGADGASSGGGSGGAAAAGQQAGQAGQAQGQLFTEDLLGEAAGPAAGGSSGGADALADLLGEPRGAAGGGAGTVGAAGAGDLLAGLDVPAAAAPVQPAGQAAQAPADTAADDLFGGMLLGGGASGTPQQPVPAAASAPLQPAPAAPQPAANLSDLDLLGGLSMPVAAAPGPAAPALQQQPLGQQLPSPQQQQQQQGGMAGLGDLLGGMSLGGLTPSAPGLSPGFSPAGLPSAPAAYGMPGPGPAFQPMGTAPHGVMAGGQGMHGPGPMGGVRPEGLSPMGMPGAGAYQTAPPGFQQPHQPFGQPQPFSQPQPFGQQQQQAFGQQPQPFGQPHPFAQQQQQQQQPFGHMGGGLGLNGSGPVHGRQPSLGSAPSGGMARLGSIGIVDSTKDNSFNFVDDAIAAARRKH